MKPPICVGSERVNWGARSSRFITSDHAGKRQHKKGIFCSVKTFLFVNEYLCLKVNVCVHVGGLLVHSVCVCVIFPYSLGN